MRDESSIRALKLLCGVLGVVIVWQCATIAARKDPLADVRLPDLEIRVQTITNSEAAPKGTKEATTNSAAVPSQPRLPRGMAPPSPLAPLAQSRVERIRDSEIFGMVPRPMPMALLGIAGPDAFIRTAMGQTGLLREGETLGDVKLLRIGTNRVLIEQQSQQKELTIFEGMGSDSLLPK